MTRRTETRREALVAFGLSAMAALTGCVEPCENRVQQELLSPGGGRLAVVFERSCGATTGFSTHVSVLNAGESLGVAAGNVFTADGDHGAARDLRVTIRWQSEQRLAIEVPAKARVFRQENRVAGVEVVYTSRP